MEEDIQKYSPTVMFRGSPCKLLIHYLLCINIKYTKFSLPIPQFSSSHCIRILGNVECEYEENLCSSNLGTLLTL